MSALPFLIINKHDGFFSQDIDLFNNVWLCQKALNNVIENNTIHSTHYVNQSSRIMLF